MQPVVGGVWPPPSLKGLRVVFVPEIISFIIKRKTFVKRRTHITLQFLAFLGMFDVRAVSHTGEFQSINLLSVFFLDQIRASYTNAAAIFTFPQAHD